MTLSTPLKVLGLAALALALAGAGAVTLVLGHVRPTHHRAAAAVGPTTAHTVAPTPKPVTHAAPPKPAPALRLAPGLPAPLRSALVESREVVAFLYVPSSPDDRALLAQVRNGAHDARVGFVALNAHDPQVAEATFAWARSSAVPATFVVRRPGTVAFTIQGLTDRTTVAQAAASAK